MSSFQIIQGGMGVGVSSWRLARAVSILDQLGVVSGTGLAITLARKLQDGDLDGRMRWALSQFPVAEIAQRVLDRYFIPGGKAHDDPYLSTPLPQLEFCNALNELTVTANYVEVFLAKEGHSGVIGINLLEKIQTPTLASLYGAMLAGVDYVLMGAGIPRFIPGILDALAAGHATEFPIDVANALPGETFKSHFDPADFLGGPPPILKRPRFFPIVASSVLATTLARKSNGQIDGFVVEGATAGGHNAPPRGPTQHTPRGEPLYGPRDEIDLTKIAELGLPFYLAGGYGRPGMLSSAIGTGASGIQVGTAFAFCEESGIAAPLKHAAIEQSLAGTADIFTDPLASPTGFPFKVLSLPQTLSESELIKSRQRVCDLGYLRKLYRRPNGSVGYRCPAEPIDTYLNKGGDLSETHGRKCICNALFATIGLPQHRPNQAVELPVVTAGDDIANLSRYCQNGKTTYTAADVINQILNLTL